MANRRSAGTRERGEASASLRSLHARASGSRWAWPSPLDDLHTPIVYLLLATTLGGAVVVHGVATPGYDLTVLYLAPTVLAAWRLGMLSGLLWAATATVAWAAVSVATAGPDGVSSGAVVADGVAGNAALRFAILALAAAGFGALRSARETVRTLAGTDVLTGVQNAAAFRDLVELERSRALRYNRPFTLAYLDVDGFRVVNQEWGHTAGDQALRLVATTMRESIRSMDTVARMGGDEFGLLFPETGKEGAAVVLDKIQSRLVAAVGDRSFALTFTIGGVVCVGAPESVDALVRRAETLMYGAKESGGSAIRIEVLEENFGIEAILQRS